jgi:outer membrane lipoprotein-sorting protein
MKYNSKVTASLLMPALFVAALTLFPVGGLAQSAAEIMKHSHLAYYYPADDGVSMVEMKLTDKRGKERKRKFIMLRMDNEEGGRQKYFTYFIEPNDVKRMTFMVWKYTEKDDDRWIYIPALDLVKRIAAKDKNSSFVGSDFSYEDISGRHWTEDEHSLLTEDVLDEHDVFVIRSVPLQAENASFSYKKSWIDKQTYLPLKEEYYDKKDALTKIFTADKIEEIEGYFIVTGRTMVDIKKNHRTTVVLSDIQLNAGIEDNIFTERYLRRPPSRFIK